MTTGNSPIVIGVGLIWIALLTAVFAFVRARAGSVDLTRLRADTTTGPGRLTTVTELFVRRLDASRKNRQRTTGLPKALESAGLRYRPGDFIVVVASMTLAATAAGLVLSGVPLAVISGSTALVLAKMSLTVLASRRRAAFADQLDDSLQLLSGSLRAGHSLLQALDSVSREAEKPTSVEFARLVNETRVGRDLTDTLDEVATRMRSDDFAWVAQAIAIHREVGGDLADVLGTVSATIRERNQIRRQIGALSAEGKLSAIVLMALPVGVTGFLSMSNPDYLRPFTEGLVGYGMIAAAVLLLVVGGLWLRKVVSFKF